MTLGILFDGIGGFPLAAVRSASDSARYKALGNSAAVPCMGYIMQGIELALRTAG